LISGANRVFTNPQKHFPTAQHKSDLKKGRVGTGYIPNTSSQTVSMRYMFEEGEEFITGRVSEHIVRYITYFFFSSSLSSNGTDNAMQPHSPV
jgi:hypothetical protein